MPLYEFECVQCGEIFEDICGVESTPDCPACGAGHARRLVACPAPLKTGAFPYKIGPAHPMAGKMAQGINSACAMSSGCSGCGAD